MNSALLFEFGLKSTVILAAAAIATLFLRQWSASLRHAIWGCSLAGLIVLPAAAWLAPQWHTEAMRPVARLAPVEAMTRYSMDVFADSGPSIPWVGIVWMAGVLIVLSRLTLHYVSGISLVGRSLTWVEEGPDVLLSRESSMPMAFGAVQPVVVLPADAPEWSEERLRLVVLHERLHIARQDTRVTLMAQMVCALYWFNPMVWFALHRLRAESEQACDDAVLLTGEEAPVYASHLVEIARSVQFNRPVPEGGIPMARMSQLEQRLRALLNPALVRATVGWKMLTTVSLVMLAVLLPLAAMRAPAQVRSANPGISGVVKDASGAVIPKARVRVRSADGKQVEFALTKDDGTFVLAPLDEGSWTVTITSDGFAEASLNNVAVKGASPTPVAVTLPLGAQTTAPVVVTADSGTNAVSGTPGPPKRIKVGGNVQSAMIVDRKAPKYPPECKAERIEGSVVLKTVISKEGAALSVEPINKLVDARLVEAAVSAVKEWRWKPTLLNGNPVEVMTEVQINFTLAP